MNDNIYLFQHALIVLTRADVLEPSSPPLYLILSASVKIIAWELKDAQISPLTQQMGYVA